MNALKLRRTIAAGEDGDLAEFSSDDLGRYIHRSSSRSSTPAASPSSMPEAAEVQSRHSHALSDDEEEDGSEGGRTGEDGGLLMASHRTDARIRARVIRPSLSTGFALMRKKKIANVSVGAIGSPYSSPRIALQPAEISAVKNTHISPALPSAEEASQAWSSPMPSPRTLPAHGSENFEDTTELAQMPPSTPPVVLLPTVKHRHVRQHSYNSHFDTEEGREQELGRVHDRRSPASKVREYERVSVQNGVSPHVKFIYPANRIVSPLPPTEQKIHSDSTTASPSLPFVPQFERQTLFSPNSVKSALEHTSTQALTTAVPASVVLEKVRSVDGLTFQVQPSSTTSSTAILPPNATRTQVGGSGRGGGASRNTLSPISSSSPLSSFLWRLKEWASGQDIVSEWWSRFIVLMILMLIQSISSFILQRFENLLSKNVEITLFLTMLVGAGGNAGNQAAVGVIRGIAVGTHQLRGSWSLMKRELQLGLMLATSLLGVAFLRVILFSPSITSRDSLFPTSPAPSATTVVPSPSRVWQVAWAISIALFAIVLTSVVLGTALPLGFHALGCDPGHAGPAIQVLMDIVGVLMTCLVCEAML